METKINIAAILKDKPQGTKLYDWLHNIDVEFDNVETTEIETSIWCTRDKGGYNELFGYSKLGTLRGWLDGLQILLPSKKMRDWRKFAWKKGDVLVSKDNVHIIFEKFEDDTYTRFKGKHYLWEECNVEYYNKEETKMLTSAFEKAADDVAQTYIKTIEEHLDGKLNLKTLEVEKEQPEFKDGDIVFMKGIKGGYYANCIFILRSEYKDGDERAFYYAFYNADDKFTTAEYGYTIVHYSLRPATDSERQQLFDALAKKGKRWDSERKHIVDLKPKVEFKPFDKVLVRDSKLDKWRANLFGYISKDGYYCCVYANWVYCIPYKGNEHMLGTTKDVEG